MRYSLSRHESAAAALDGSKNTRSRTPLARARYATHEGSSLGRHSTDTPESGRIRVRGILHPQQKYPSTRPDGIAQAKMALSSVEGSAVGARAARLTRRDLMRSN